MYPYNIKLFNPDSNEYKTAHVFAKSLQSAFTKAEKANPGFLTQRSI